MKIKTFKNTFKIYTNIMSDIDFKSFTDEELITYCKDNNISYLNKPAITAVYDKAKR